MPRYRMDDYERTVAGHELEPPATFNFGADVVDAWARDPSKLALIWCDAEGNERRLTFDEVARPRIFSMMVISNEIGATTRAAPKS